MSCGMTCSVTATSPSVTRAYVGASGFSYPEWRGSFYPADAKPPEYLRPLRLAAERRRAQQHLLPAAGGGAVPALGGGDARGLPLLDQGAEVDLASSAGSTSSARSPSGSPCSGRAWGRCWCARTTSGRVTTASSSCCSSRSTRRSSSPSISATRPGRASRRACPTNAVRVNQLESAAPFRYLRFSEHPYDDEALSRAADTVRGLGVETYCMFSKGEADDHSPAGEPTAVTAERFLRALG